MKVFEATENISVFFVELCSEIDVFPTEYNIVLHVY